ncbi:MAG: hypothetical protein K2L07_13150 [Lachnospiraceae bacterium]|nr:hypothetical protein [Lachnospiraceae bacterium]
MSNILKGIILVVMIIYIVSPIDACPGPIDDLIVLFIGMAARKGIKERGSVEMGSEMEPCD